MVLLWSLLLGSVIVGGLIWFGAWRSWIGTGSRLTWAWGLMIPWIGVVSLVLFVSVLLRTVGLTLPAWFLYPLVLVLLGIGLFSAVRDRPNLLLPPWYRRLLALRNLRETPAPRLSHRS